MKVKTNQRSGFDPIKVVIDIETYEDLEALIEALKFSKRNEVEELLKELKKYC